VANGGTATKGVVSQVATVDAADAESLCVKENPFKADHRTLPVADPVASVSGSVHRFRSGFVRVSGWDTESTPRFIRSDPNHKTVPDPKGVLPWAV
jgi:hypothetical protein